MLPTEKSLKTTKLSTQIVLIYGPPKIGKSTFCADANKAIVFATEPGVQNLDCYQVNILCWTGMPLQKNEKTGEVEGSFQDACAEIRDSEHDFTTVVIDTIDNLYQMCREYVLGVAKVDHESEVPGWGTGYAKVSGELMSKLRKLSMLDPGLWMISHSKTKTIEGHLGKHDQTMPTLPNSVQGPVVGLADMVLFFDMEPRLTPDRKEGEPKYVTDPETGDIVMNRVMRTKPHPDYIAGDRTSVGIPSVIPMDFKVFSSYFSDNAAGVNTGKKQK